MSDITLEEIPTDVQAGIQKSKRWHRAGFLGLPCFVVGIILAEQGDARL